MILFGGIKLGSDCADHLHTVFNVHSVGLAISLHSHGSINLVSMHEACALLCRLLCHHAITGTAEQ